MLTRLLLFFLVLAAIVRASGQGSQVVKRALIIAIGDYNPDQTGWRPISSANDARLLEPTLQKQQFEVEIISNPTKSQIETAIERLRVKSQLGDIVLIHISSHGVQVTDDNGDEADGFDECIVPIDAPDVSKMPLDYKGEKHLRDDRLGELLTGIRVRLGPTGDLLVLLDACHSGTGTRGPGGIVRGGTEPLRLAGLPQKSNASEDQNAFFDLPKGPNLSDITFLSAAQANHLNYENTAQRCGSLTSAFCSILNEAGAAIPYQSLFERVQTKIAQINACYQTGQRPELESTRPGRTLFGGPVVVMKQNFSILSLNPDRQTAIINGGKLSGIEAGALLSIYRTGDRPTTAKALDSAVVESASEMQATVKFSGQIPIKKSVDGVFYLDRRVFRDDTLFVNSDSLPAFMQTTIQQLRKSVAYPIAIRQSGFDVSAMLRDGGKGKDIQFYLPATGQFYPKTSASPDTLITILESLYWGKMLRRITLRQEDISINWSFECRPTTDSTPYLQTINGKLHARQAASGYYLRIQNGSNVPIWFNIVDFQPDGLYSIQWPKPDTQEEGYRLESGMSRTIHFGLGAPFGDEVFKLFAATSPLDMRLVVDGQSRGPAPTDTPLTRFLKNRLSTRGPTYPADPKEGKTMEIHYVITP